MGFLPFGKTRPGPGGCITAPLCKPSTSDSGRRAVYEGKRGLGPGLAGPEGMVLIFVFDPVIYSQ